MSNNPDPLQTDDVVNALTTRGECVLLHLETGHEVALHKDNSNERLPWAISFVHADILETSILKQALALGLELRLFEGMSVPRYELHRNCFGVRAAAMKALSLARLLPGVPPLAWLWVTTCEYDNRDEPPSPPAPWPPTR